MAPLCSHKTLLPTNTAGEPHQVGSDSRLAALSHTYRPRALVGAVCQAFAQSPGPRAPAPGTHPRRPAYRRVKHVGVEYEAACGGGASVDRRERKTVSPWVSGTPAHHHTLQRPRRPTQVRPRVHRTWESRQAEQRGRRRARLSVN